MSPQPIYTLSLVETQPSMAWYSVARQTTGDEVVWVQTLCDNGSKDNSAIRWGDPSSLVGETGPVLTSGGSCTAFVTDKPWLKRPPRLSNTVTFVP